MAVLQHHAFLEAQAVTMQLNHALDSRVAIEQAKGILAERDSVDMAVAFDRPLDHARHHSLRLADVARGVIAGTLNAGSLVPPPSGGS
ncbi:MAG: ANTAR domain-containing protein [Acidimicrobiia bacterium]